MCHVKKEKFPTKTRPTVTGTFLSCLEHFPVVVSLYNIQNGRRLKMQYSELYIMSEPFYRISHA